MTSASVASDRGLLAYQVVAASRPKHTYRGAVVGCGRMGSTIDDEVVGNPSYPWPWAHAPAMIDAEGVELVAGVDLIQEQRDDFGRRWGVKTYADVGEMVAKERPDIVSVTTRLAERPGVVIALAEAGVKAIYPTKPLSRTLAEADAMIETCRRNNSLLVVATHLNWDARYTSTRELIARGEIGPLRSMVCHTPPLTQGLSRLHSHTFALLRLFAEAPARWVFGYMDDEESAAGSEELAAADKDDLAGSGYVVYENGVRAFMNSYGSHGSWDIEFICERGRVISRNQHAWFELWGQDSQTGDSIQRQFPNPWRPRSSMVDAFEGIARSIEAGEETTSPGEFGREALEIALAMRESHRQGGVRVDLPLADRSLGMGEHTRQQAWI